MFLILLLQSGRPWDDPGHFDGINSPDWVTLMLLAIPVMFAFGLLVKFGRWFTGADEREREKKREEDLKRAVESMEKASEDLSNQFHAEALRRIEEFKRDEENRKKD